MSIFIKQNLQATIVWRLDEPLVSLNVNNITSIKASGVELDTILNCVNNIPTVQCDSVNWYGDHAKFIMRWLMSGKREEYFT